MSTNGSISEACAYFDTGPEFVPMGMGEAKARMQRLHIALAVRSDAPTVSVGLALLANGDCPDSLIDRADRALYAERADQIGRRPAS